MEIRKKILNIKIIIIFLFDYALLKILRRYTRQICYIIKAVNIKFYIYMQIMIPEINL